MHARVNASASTVLLSAGTRWWDMGQDLLNQSSRFIWPLLLFHKQSPVWFVCFQVGWAFFDGSVIFWVWGRWVGWLVFWFSGFFCLHTWTRKLTYNYSLMALNRNKKWLPYKPTYCLYWYLINLFFPFLLLTCWDYRKKNIDFNKC